MSTDTDLDRMDDPGPLEDDPATPVEDGASTPTEESATVPSDTSGTSTTTQQNGEPGTETPDTESGTETSDEEFDPQASDEQPNSQTLAGDQQTTADGETSQDGDFGEIGSGGRYWTVELVRPPGAGPGLTAYIAMAEAAIQTAVDLLGRGMPKPPPQVDELLSTKIHETLGKGEADKAYQQALTEVEAKQTSLLTMDNQVIDTSIVISAEQDQTLRSIINIVEQLNSSLSAVGGAELKPAQEIKLMDLVASAVDAVYDKVAAVADLNSEMAGNSGNGSDSGTGGTPGGGQFGGGQPGAGAAGGGGGLGMLAMLPMALMPLAGMLPELLQPEEEDEQDKEEPPSEQAPQTLDPTAPPGDAQSNEDSDEDATAGQAPETQSPAPDVPEEGTQSDQQYGPETQA